MEKKAVITLISVQNGDEEQKIEVVTPGKFYKNNDDEPYTVEYQETEISGMGDTYTTFQIGDECFSLKREGDINSTMEFKNGNNTSIIYDTVYGMLTMQLYTNKLDISVDEFGGTVDIDYDMTVGNDEPINTRLTLNIKTVE